MSKKIKNMWDEEKITMRDLANMVEWKEVETALNYHYRDYPSVRLKKALKQVRDCRKHTYKDEDPIQIYISGTRSFTEDEWGDREEYYGIAGVGYSLSFQKWNKLANMPITRTTLDNHTVPEMLAHFIWEITWYGSEIQTKKTGDRIRGLTKKAIKKCKKLSK